MSGLNVHKGTEFYVYLPIVENTFKKQEIQTKELIIGGTESVLFVDDENNIIAMERQVLVCRETSVCGVS